MVITQDELQWTIPASWPESLKALFSQPSRKLSLDAFRVPVTEYAEATTPLVDDKGNPVKAAMYRTKAGGIPSWWTFSAPNRRQDGQRQASLTLTPRRACTPSPSYVTDGEEYVHFVMKRRPPFGGKTKILQNPAGIMDKPNTPLLTLGMGEVHEETPYRPVDARLLNDGPIPASPGAATEQKAYIVVRAVYDAQKADKDYREGAELLSATRASTYR